MFVDADYEPVAVLVEHALADDALAVRLGPQPEREHHRPRRERADLQQTSARMQPASRSPRDYYRRNWVSGFAPAPRWAMYSDIT